MREFIPELYFSLKRYSVALFKKDLQAGCTVGVIALPLAMAFAIASGVDPIRGLYTAIIAGFLISLLGGSKVQIGGPTGAFVVIVYDIIQRTGYEGLCLATLLAGMMLIVLGLFRIGNLIQYIPRSLIIGFTTGLAVCIFSTQIKDFFGFTLTSVPVSFLEKWLAFMQNISTIQYAPTCLGFGALGGIVLLRKYAPKLPWGITTIVIWTLIAFFLQLPVETIESRFGAISRALPSFHLPTLSLLSPEIIKDSLTIAFLGGVESLLSAVIGDGMKGHKHRPNCELIAQGIANCGAICFGGIPATGAIARTVANVKTGAHTPIAGIVHALSLAAILFCIAPLAGQIPLAILAAVLVMVSWNMSELPHFLHILKGPRNDQIILISTFLCTVFIDITVAISVGMIFACLLFRNEIQQAATLTAVEHKNTVLYEIKGPFFFATVNLLQKFAGVPPQICILRLHSVSRIDASGAHALLELHRECKRRGIELYLSEIQEKIKKDLDHFHVLKTFGKQILVSPEDLIFGINSIEA